MQERDRALAAEARRLEAAKKEVACLRKVRGFNPCEAAATDSQTFDLGA